MDNTYKYPAIPPRQLDENSPIVGCDGEQLSTLTEYWKWAHSDLLGNTERGIFAEYLVRIALNITSNRLSWDKYDLLYKERIRIEVKSSAYIQTWGQKELSSISFSISPSLGWDVNSNSYEDTRKRQSDIYVFCLLDCKDQSVVQPTDTSQWVFYVLSTKVLDEQKPTSKSISLSALTKLPVIECRFNTLKQEVDRIITDIS
ncbi:MAG TPA: hypothetical protein PLH83_08840 [Ruminococcus sp.]|nr:hypothetical protein [Ruminococcus sp.]